MHDKFGRELKAGDKVLIPCVVKETYATEEYCNVALETIDPMPPYEAKNAIVLNTKQVVKGSIE